MNDDTRVASDAYRALLRAPTRELGEIMRRGETPDFDRMAGWEYRGFNRPEPFEAQATALMKLAGIQKFIKGFYRDRTGTGFGYNEPAVQNGPEGPWIARPDPDRPKRFGFYRVVPVDPCDRDNRYLQALLLDYGAGPNPPWEPARVLRDYLVRVERGSDDLLLGAATVALGPLRIPTNYFVLERHRHTAWSGDTHAVIK
ncbi:MAG: hypothetical protein HYY06_29840 [Deltaproteobacteria bacterium]|nr:hypothetical protein [Deltaproteobacteria bacterium]